MMLNVNTHWCFLLQDVEPTRVITCTGIASLAKNGGPTRELDCLLWLQWYKPRASSLETSLDHSTPGSLAHLEATRGTTWKA